MENDLYEIVIAFECGSTFEILTKLSDKMNIKIDIDKIWHTMRVEDRRTPDAICIFRDNNDANKFIMLDCTAPCEIFNLIVRCNISESDNIKKIIIDVLESVKSYPSKYLNIYNFRNEYGIPNNDYDKALKRSGLVL